MPPLVRNELPVPPALVRPRHVQPLPVAQRVAHLHQRPRDPLQRRADEPHRPRQRVTHDTPQSAVLRRVQADADRLATPPRPPCFQVTVASHSPARPTRHDPIADVALRLFYRFQPLDHFGTRVLALIAGSFDSADTRVVACAIGSSESVARLAKSLECFSVLFHVPLDALDASDSTIDVNASSNVATRQRNGSCCQDRTSPCDADPVQP